ncbi:c-type cytochrome [Sphingomonas montanisoli]|uniref:C-type cytochrome n=1 Tax=Sphingomonas montanisoli TaxID=2606412 RepID=A0A5D9C8E5_9SPHN|nr:c-type cytochrome [Sphingomonas montanisoli]TZG27360.1 c-type cytochrome [Sphingomonas montanisoli]
MRKTILTVAMALAGVAAVAQTTHAPTVAAEPNPDLAPAKVFSDNCAACHQEDGKGIEGAFPALAGDAFVLGDPRQAIHVVLEGRAGMPTFKADLTDAQIAAALTHVRTAWGNAAGAVTPAMVKAQRDGEAPTDTQKPISAH